MKLWIGLLVSLLVATACLVACGDSDDGPGVRNAALLTSDTTEVKVSSGDDSKGDSDYNDASFTFKSVCHWADNGTVSTRVLQLNPVEAGATLQNRVHLRLPPLSTARVTKLGSQAFLHDTLYIASEGTTQLLCDDPNQALAEQPDTNKRQILAALERADSKSVELSKTALEELLLYLKASEPSHKIPSDTKSSDADDDDLAIQIQLRVADDDDLAVRIQLTVLGREGESVTELEAREREILTDIDLCPSRQEGMQDSHPLGPYSLHLLVMSSGGPSAPQKCLLGRNPDSFTIRWGLVCGHPHGFIRIPNGGSCSDVGIE